MTTTAISTLAQAEAALAQLDAERARVQRRLAALRSAGVTQTHGTIPAARAIAPERIALFRSLFRGREDVYAMRWVSTKTGKTGYSPACTREWMQRMWREPELRRQQRPPEALLLLTDAAIRDHLEGRGVLGVYPLLTDERCWFLAVDFDGKAMTRRRVVLPPELRMRSRRCAQRSTATPVDWWADVQAFAATCAAHHVSVTIERSRSGNGAHAWVFFTEPLAAATARTMGSFLITETMERRHAITFASYDRFFPNQDTMPDGGFGNLIALPFQGDVVSRGSSVFVDNAGKPYPDQWAFLTQIERMVPSAVEGIASEARQRGRIIGVAMGETDVDDGKPWDRPPSRARQHIVFRDPLPSTIHAVRAQRLFIPTDGLPPRLCSAITRIAAFQNPEFYAKQRLRLSVALTPRVIACVEECDGYLALPRGCEDDVRALLQAHGSILAVDDRTHTGIRQPWTFHGELSDVQTAARTAMLRYDTGVFVAPPGSGKTVVGIAAIAARQQPTLVLVHRKPLLEQWIAQLACFLGITPDAIGRIGGGASTPNGILDVGMLQSLVRKGVVDDRVANYGHIVVDECHHLPAFSFEQVLAEAKARYILGLTATPYRRDGHQPIIAMQCGPVRYAIASKTQAATRPFVHRLIVRETTCPAVPRVPEGERMAMHRLYQTLADDAARNSVIVTDVRSTLAEGRTPIVLTERRDHLQRLADLLTPHVAHCVVLRGGATAIQRRALMEALATVPKGEPLAILATGRYIGEGFDDARLDTLFLALPVSWKGTLVQYAGRLHRLHPDKREVRIYDYVDQDIPTCMRMFDKRMKGYRALGYAVAAPDGNIGMSVGG